MSIVVMSPGRPQLEHWRNGLCGCLSDCSTCCMALLFPCVLYGQNVELMDGSSCCSNCCLYCVCMSIGCTCLIHSGKRTSYRINAGLYESCCSDCCVVYYCGCCALAQEARELRDRGPPGKQSMSMVAMMPSSPTPPSNNTTIHYHQGPASPVSQSPHGSQIHQQQTYQQQQPYYEPQQQASPHSQQYHQQPQYQQQPQQYQQQPQYQQQQQPQYQQQQQPQYQQQNQFVQDQEGQMYIKKAAPMPDPVESGQNTPQRPSLPPRQSLSNQGGVAYPKIS